MAAQSSLRNKGNFIHLPLTHEVRLCREVPSIRSNCNNYMLLGYWQTYFNALYLHGQGIAGVKG